MPHLPARLNTAPEGIGSSLHRRLPSARVRTEPRLDVESCEPVVTVVHHAPGIHAAAVTRARAAPRPRHPSHATPAGIRAPASRTPPSSPAAPSVARHPHRHPPSRVPHALAIPGGAAHPTPAPRDGS
ncbi:MULTISPECIES: hypothetical protein [Microbacterium]|uniref:hypothetical protein n=1 Tax=Microbacterium TaxID=33882 RepID=UPI0027821089|nr:MULTISPECIES: hypothetical protein [Microbacterium]MDQ1082876.1 hypothetical protein [Microbacterium sp. SORGH_AS_0344]MDQ1168355.1 hypothetical protein [Microbacterium proteolyticum]